MSRIVLVRHAEAAGDDSDDPGLSELGQRQALQLADALAMFEVGAVWHGPKLRAAQTAHRVARKLGCDSVMSLHLDDLTPFPADDGWDDYPRIRWSWLEQIPLEERDPGGVVLTEAWASLQSQSETLVAVTHSFVIGWFVSLAMHGSVDTWTHLSVSNASITEIETRPDGHHVVHRFNDTSHLVG